ncbi:unnamed protein product, partial [Owenia fusiformis]
TPLSKLPGPPGWPLIGNALDMNSYGNTLETLVKWRNKYGDVFKVDLFGEEIVMVSGQYINEMLVSKGKEFAARPELPLIAGQLPNGSFMVRQNYDERTIFVRKLAHKALKQFGEGLDKIEKVSMSQITVFMDELQQDFLNKDFDPDDPLAKCFTQIVNIMVTGTTLQEDSYLLEEHKELDMIDGRILGGHFALLDTFPSLIHFPFVPGVKEVKRYSELRQSIQAYWKSTEDTFDPENLRGIYDVYFKAHKDFQNSDDVQFSYNYNNIKDDVFEIFIGGFVTTHKFLLAFINIMASNQKLQANIQKQIDDVIGQTNEPSLHHRGQLGFLEATIYEIFRYGSHTPLAVPHMTQEATSIGGYDLPKGTQVWPMLWSMHHDERFWDEPWKFKPERFMTQEGNLASADTRKMLMPFGAGARGCVGEVFAKSRIFLFTATLLQRFNILPPREGQFKPWDIKSKEYFRCMPLKTGEFKIRVEPR